MRVRVIRVPAAWDLVASVASIIAARHPPKLLPHARLRLAVRPAVLSDRRVTTEPGPVLRHRKQVESIIRWHVVLPIPAVLVVKAALPRAAKVVPSRRASYAGLLPDSTSCDALPAAKFGKVRWRFGKFGNGEGERE
jgi:hypothetical protein